MRLFLPKRSLSYISATTRAQQQRTRSPAPKRVLHSSDAGADDFVATCLLSLDPSAKLEAVCITNADCVPQYALAAYDKLSKMFSTATPIGLSEARCFHSFPWKWRGDTIRINQVSTLNSTLDQHRIQPRLNFEGDEILASVLEKASPKDQAQIVAAGPLTTLANIFKEKPHLMKNVAALHWMGGALDVPGNVEASSNGEFFLPLEASSIKAEWNVFADAFAADWMLRNATDFDIHLIPLDVCNYAKLTRDFLDKLAASESKYARFVSECYGVVSNPDLYHMWDVVTAATLTRPDLFMKPIPVGVKVETGVPHHGAIVRENGASGREVLVYTQFKNGNVDSFRRYILETLENKAT